MEDGKRNKRVLKLSGLTGGRRDYAELDQGGVLGLSVR